MKHVTSLAIGLAAVSVVGCGPEKYDVVQTFERGEYLKIIEVEKTWAPKSKQDEALRWLRAGSASASAGYRQEAYACFVNARKIMWSFDQDPDAVYRDSIPHSEKNKPFHGDPYEQMMVFFYLGLLEYMGGDFGKAQANFKLALLADAGTKDDRYYSDSIVVLLMRAKSLRKLGEDRAAVDALRRAKWVPWYRWSIQCLGEVIPSATARVKEKYAVKHDQLQRELVLALELLLSPGRVAATDYPTPTDTLNQCRHVALTSVWRAAGAADARRRKETLLGLNPDRVAGWIDVIWQEALAEMKTIDTEAARSEKRRFEAHLEAAASSDNNLLVLVEVGRGPEKYATGKHNSVLCYRGCDCPVRTVRVTASDERLAASHVGDVRFQATTRGGREMDHVLHGRAVFKDVTKVSGMGLAAAAKALGMVAAAQSAATAGTSAGAGATAGASAGAGTGAGAAGAGASMAIPIVGIAVGGAALGSMLLSSATNPEADTRYWETLPDRIYMVTGKLPTGQHRLTMDCLDQAGGPVPGYGATAREITVQADRETVVLIRAGPFQPHVDKSGKKIEGRAGIAQSMRQASGLAECVPVER